MRKAGFPFSFFAPVLALGLSLTLPLREASAQPSSPQPSPRSLLTVEGNGVAEAKPDYARLMVELLAKAPTIEGAVEASKTLVPRVDTLLLSLKNEGVEAESSNFSVVETAPSGPVPNGPQKPPPSFAATTSYSLKLTNIDRLNGVIGELASSGILEMRTVSFHVADEHAPTDEARRNAVADARRQAQVLADAAGVRLDDLASISDVRAAARSPSEYALAKAARTYLHIIPPAKLEFSASIVMSWHISPKP